MSAQYSAATSPVNASSRRAKLIRGQLDVRSVAVAVRDGTGTVRAAMNVTVHAAETPVQTLLDDYLPLLTRTAGDISAEWALWQSRPHIELTPDQLRAAG
jgi:hypothetical protein